MALSTSHTYFLNRCPPFGDGWPSPSLQRPLIQSFAFLIYEQQDLHKARRFWEKVGLTVVEQSEHWLAMSTSEGAPLVLIATKGRRSRFVGSAFLVDKQADFGALVREEGAIRLPQVIVPGGGEAVSIVDQGGQEVWLIKR